MRALPRTQHAGRRLFADPAPPGNTAHQRADDGAADGGASISPRAGPTLVTTGHVRGRSAPAERAARWMETFGVELLDGLGTAEMWHIFISNRPALCPGLWVVSSMASRKTLRRRWPGGRDGQVGALWVKGDSRAIGYWQGTTTPCRHFASGKGMYPATCSDKMPMAPMCIAAGVTTC